MNNEEWRPMVGWEGIFSVSSFGRIRKETQFGRWPVGYITHGTKNYWGYMVFAPKYNGRISKPRGIHLFVLESFLSMRPLGLVANHKDGTKSNNKIENLEWITYGANNTHAYRTGLSKRPKLNMSIANDIRQSQDSYAILANKYNVTKQAIYAVKRGISYVSP